MPKLTKLTSPIALAGARLWSRRGRAGLAALAAAASGALIATVLAASLTVSDRTLARGITDLPGSERAVGATWGGLPPQEPGGGFAELDRLAKRALTPITGQSASAFVLYRETRIGGALVDLAAGNDLGRWIRLQSGRLPRRCTLSRCEVVQVAGAGPLPRGFVGVGEGSLVSKAPFGSLVGSTTAGSIIQAAERWHRPAAPPFVVAEGARAAGSLPALSYDYRSYRWIAPLEPGDVHPWNIDAFTRRLAEARAALESSSGLFRLDAPDTQLHAADATGRAGGRRLLLLGGEAAALLLAFVILVGAGFRRDSDASRLRLTWLGASRSQLVLESGTEALTIAAVGTAAGWFLGVVPALLVARHFGSPGAAVVRHSLLSPEGIAIAAGLALAAALILLATVWAPTLRIGGMRLSGLDLAAVGAAAVVAIAFARGATDTSELAGGQGTGAVLLLLPGLVVFVAAVAATRAVGVLPRALERLARRGPLPARLAALSLARNPGRAAIAVGFMVVSLGLALFAAVYRSTLISGERDEASFAVPAAAIVSEDDSKLVPVLKAAPLTAYERSGRATPVIRLSGNVQSGQSFTLLEMPAPAVASVDGWRSSFASESLAELGRRIAPAGAVALHTVPVSRGRLTLPVSATGFVRIRAAIETLDGGFRYVTVPGPTPRGRLLGFAFDLTNKGLDREAISGEGAHPLGTLLLRFGRPQVDGRPLAVDFRRWRGTGTASADTRARRVSIRFLATSDVQPGFRLRQPMDGKAVPIVVSPAIAAAAGGNGLLALQVEGTRVLARIVATATRFPSINGDFVLADRQTLSTAMNSDAPGTAVTSEIWLGAQPSSGPPFNLLRVRTQQALEDRLSSDPLSRGSLLALVVAALAGLALALAGLLLVVVSDLRDERGELFDLEAQGATPSALRRHLRLRAAMVVAMGLGGGIATGAVLSALVVALVRVTANATEPQPPLVLTLDWGLVAIGLCAFLALSAALVAGATWRAFRAESAGRFAEVGW